MRRNAISVAAVVLAALAVGIGIYVYRKDLKQPAGLPSEEPAKEINLSAIIPLTGWSAEFGSHEKLATEIAVRHLEMKNPNWNINLSIEDTASEVDQAVTAFRRVLQTNRPHAVLVESSGASLALANMVDQESILMLSVSANPEVTQNSQFAFRALPTATEETEAIVRYAAEHLRVQKLALLHLDNDYGLGFKQPFEDFGAQSNVELAFVESFPSDARDFRPQISKLISAESDAVFIVGYGSAMGILIKQLRENNYPGYIMGTSSVIYDDVISVAPEAMEGVIFADIPYDITQGTGRVADFVKQYKTGSGKLPSPLAAIAYDGISMLVEALIETSTDTGLAREHLIEKGFYNGINGRIGIPSTRDLQYSLEIKEVVDGAGTVITEELKEAA